MPVRSTKTMPSSALRSSSGGRPPLGRGARSGSRGATSAQSVSDTSGFRHLPSLTVSRRTREAARAAGPPAPPSCGPSAFGARISAEGVRLRSGLPRGEGRDVAIRTALTDLLGIEAPVLLAPMAFISGGALSAAVGRAGGLGFLGGGYGDRAWLEEEARRAGGERLGVGFITWSLACQPDLLDLALDLLAPPAVQRSSVPDVARRLDWPAPWTIRTLENAFMARWRGDLDGRRADAGEVERYARAREAGDFDTAAVIAGEAADLVRAVEPAGRIVEQMVGEAEALLRRGPAWLGGR